MATVYGLRQETYIGEGCEAVKMFSTCLEIKVYTDPAALELAAFLQEKRAEILNLAARADQLAQRLKSQPQNWVVCHSAAIAYRGDKTQ